MACSFLTMDCPRLVHLRSRGSLISTPWLPRRGLPAWRSHTTRCLCWQEWDQGVPVPQPQPCTSLPPLSSSSPARTSPTPPYATITTRTRLRSLCSLSAPTAQASPAHSILHARLHSSQPVCRHRNTGQLSEYPPADPVLVPLTRPLWINS